MPSIAAGQIETTVVPSGCGFDSMAEFAAECDERQTTRRDGVGDGAGMVAMPSAPAPVSPDVHPDVLAPAAAEASIADVSLVAHTDLAPAVASAVEPVPLPVPLQAPVVAAPAIESGWWAPAAIVLGLVAIAQVPFVAMWATQVRAAAPAPVATLVIESEPAGVLIRVDGTAIGPAPVRLSVPAGRRSVQLTHDGVERGVTLLVAPGETLRQSFAFLPAEPAAAVVPPPQPAQGAVRSAPTGALSGWITVDVPAPLRIFENGQLVGSTEVERLMLPVGEHVLELRSDELRFSTQQTVRVTAGTTTPVLVQLPTAPISINARPWGDVWVDGERVGDTPIGNLMRPIGRHQIVVRHPQLGERRATILSTANEPARVSVDFSNER